MKDIIKSLDLRELYKETKRPTYKELIAEIRDLQNNSWEKDDASRPEDNERTRL